MISNIYARLADEARPVEYDRALRFAAHNAEAYQGFPDAKGVLQQLRKAGYETQELQSAGIIDVSAKNLALHPALRSAANIWMPLGADAHTTFDVLTEAGTLQPGGSTLVNLFLDHQIAAALRHTRQLFVVPAVADVALLRGLGLAAVPYRALAGISLDGLRTGLREMHHLMWSSAVRDPATASEIEVAADLHTPSPAQPSPAQPSVLPEASTSVSAPPRPAPPQPAPVSGAPTQSPPTPFVEPIDMTEALSDWCATAQEIRARELQQLQAEQLQAEKLQAQEVQAHENNLHENKGHEKEFIKPSARQIDQARKSGPQGPPSPYPWESLLGFGQDDDADFEYFEEDEDKTYRDFNTSADPWLIIVAWSPSQIQAAEPPGCEALLAHLTVMHQHLGLRKEGIGVWRSSSEGLEAYTTCARHGTSAQLARYFTRHDRHRLRTLVEPKRPAVPTLEQASVRLHQAAEREYGTEQMLQNAKSQYVEAVDRHLVEPFLVEADRANSPEERVQNMYLAERARALALHIAETQQRPATARKSAKSAEDELKERRQALALTNELYQAFQRALKDKACTVRQAPKQPPLGHFTQLLKDSSRCI